jgi:uncharacterized protein (TIGR02001 family)
MKKTLLAAAIAAAFSAPTTALAQLTGNATLVSDYRFRGISQSFKLPALQGGADYAHSSGFYVGNWNSSVSGLQFPNGASLEMDFYGGYKTTFGDFGLDVGYLYYYYPGTKAPTAPSGFRKLDNQEIYVGGTWKFLTAKVSYSTTDYFGLNGALAQGFYASKDTGAALPDRGGSKGTLYFDLTASYEIVPKLTLSAHYGRLDVKNYNELDYSDYRIGATYDLNGWLLGAAIVSTNAKKEWYYVRNGSGTTKDLGTTGLVLSVGKTF